MNFSLIELDKGSPLYKEFASDFRLLLLKEVATSEGVYTLSCGEVFFTVLSSQRVLSQEESFKKLFSSHKSSEVAGELVLNHSAKGEEIILLNRIEIYPEFRKQGLLSKTLDYLSSIYPNHKFSLIPYPLQHLKIKGEGFNSDTEKLRNYYKSLGFNSEFKDFLIK